MRNMLRDFFYFTKLERRGVLVLGILCLGLFLFPTLFLRNNENEKADFSRFKKEIHAFENALENNKSIEKNIPYVAVRLSAFDPNEVSFEDLQRFGLSGKVARIWINFLEKGGRFYKKGDVKKIYGLSDEEYLKLEDFISIPDTEKRFDNKTSVPEKFSESAFELFDFNPNLVSKKELLKLGFPERTANNLMKFRAKGGKIREAGELLKIYGMEQPLFETLLPYIKIPDQSKSSDFTEKMTNSTPVSNLVIRVNEADADTWQQLKGIGPYYANKIVNFRTKLGGFYSIDQIAETYNLPDSVFQNIKDQLTLITPNQKININTVTIEELTQHPYIKRNQAKVICNYRKQHGAFTDLSELTNIKVLSSSQIEKIKPYLSIN